MSRYILSLLLLISSSLYGDEMSIAWVKLMDKLCEDCRKRYPLYKDACVIIVEESVFLCPK